jgi:hypothetical protein
VTPDVIYLALWHGLREEKWPLTLDILNRLMTEESWDGCRFRPFKKDLFRTRMPDKKLGGKLKFTAGQVITFMTHAPALLQPHVYASDPVWIMFSLHCTIVMMTMKYAWTTQDVLTYDLAIYQWATLYVALFPGYDRPKLHFVFHLPLNVLLHGPPRLWMALKYEMKHSRLKRIAMASNWINIGYTIALTHELWQAHLLRESVHRTVTGSYMSTEECWVGTTMGDLINVKCAGMISKSSVLTVDWYSELDVQGRVISTGQRHVTGITFGADTQSHGCVGVISGLCAVHGMGYFLMVTPFTTGIQKHPSIPVPFVHRDYISTQHILVSASESFSIVSLVDREDGWTWLVHLH